MHGSVRNPVFTAGFCPHLSGLLLAVSRKRYGQAQIATIATDAVRQRS